MRCGQTKLRGSRFEEALQERVEGKYHIMLDATLRKSLCLLCAGAPRHDRAVVTATTLTCVCAACKPHEMTSAATADVMSSELSSHARAHGSPSAPSCLLRSRSRLSLRCLSQNMCRDDRHTTEERHLKQISLHQRVPGNACPFHGTPPPPPCHAPFSEQLTKPCSRRMRRHPRYWLC